MTVRIIEKREHLDRVRYMGRVAEIVGRTYGLKAEKYKHELAPKCGLFYDLRMQDSGYLFKNIHCQQTQPMDEDSETVIELRGWNPLQLVKA